MSVNTKEATSLLQSKQKIIVILLLIIVIILGLAIRLFHLMRTEIIPVDAKTFMWAAEWFLGRDSFHYYTNVPREPGWSMVLAIFFIPFPVDYDLLFIVARIVSTGFSVLNIPLTFAVSKRLAEEFDDAKGKENLIGLVASLFLAFNPIMIETASMGLREPLQGTLMLVWILLYFSKGLNKEFLIIGGFCTFFSVLIRLDTILLWTFLGMVLMYNEWSSSNNPEKRNVILKPLIVIFLAVVSFITWLSVSAVLFGDPFATSNHFLEDYFSHEFPTSEIPADLSLFSYFFEYHSMSEIAYSFVKGAASLASMYITYLGLFLGSILLISYGHFVYKGRLILPAFLTYSILFYAIFAHLWGYVGYWRLMSPYLGLCIIMVSVVLTKDLPSMEIKMSRGRRKTIPSMFILLALILIIIAYWMVVFMIA
jgi:hypothetical protein